MSNKPKPIPDGTACTRIDCGTVYEIRAHSIESNTVQLWKGGKFVTYASVKSLTLKNKVMIIGKTQNN
jgi:hypothetical protein